MNNDKCRKCGKPISWCTMPSGAKMPLDAKPLKMIQVKEGIGELIDVYQSHFATCEGANEFRGKTRKEWDRE